jgi:hypothetical protein
MRLRAFLFVALFAASCGKDSVAPDAGGGPDATTDAGETCVPCVIDTDCNAGACARLGVATYCAKTCTTTAECASGETCGYQLDVTGDAVSICVRTSSTTCGAPADAGLIECAGYADPLTVATCTSCTKQTRPDCQPNGCYNGYYCDDLSGCVPPPAVCRPDAGPPPTFYDGGPVTSAIGNDGGTESVLYFGVVGDTRPATVDDTAHYPTSVITHIFDDLGAVKPVPPFVISTGDYQFSKANGAQAQAQLQLYIAAHTNYPGIQFPTIGNHECTGATDSNCGPGNDAGTPNNYVQFMSMLLGPLQKTTPYYEIDVAAQDATWTAKFLFVAANAWDATQAAWLDQALSQTTTYTFIVRHEPAQANTAPGVIPSETAMAAHPYTLAIVGHSHEYFHKAGSREVVVGNGGAPMSTSDDFGYAIVTQRSDFSIAVDMIDFLSGLPDPKFHFAVNPDGTPAAP